MKPGHCVSPKMIRKPHVSDPGTEDTDMAINSAGLLVYRIRDDAPEVLLAHPGGPFWSWRDDGVWTVPKGLCEPGESPLAAAQREFHEETGLQVEGPFHKLGTFCQPGGKLLSIWAVAGDCDPDAVRSNEFELEWPPRSGRRQKFPEIDRVAWFSVPGSLQKILQGQRPAVEELVKLVGRDRQPAGPAQSGRDIFKPGSDSR